MKTPLRVLLVEDSDDDSLLVLNILTRAGYEIVSRRVQTEAALREALRGEVWGLVISDYCMPSFDAPAAIRIVKELEGDIPLIVVSGTVGEDVAVETLKLGADDYLLKQNLTRLVPAVERALQVAEGRRRRHELEHMKSIIMSNSLDMICTLDRRETFLEVSDAARVILGWDPEQIVGRAFLDFVSPEDVPTAEAELAAVREGRETKGFEIRCLHTSGQVRTLVWSAVWSESDNVMIVVGRDVTERYQQEETLRLLERALGKVSQGVLISDEKRLIIYANASFAGITGYAASEILGRNCSILQGPQTNAGTIQNMRAALNEGRKFDGEILNYRKDGTPFWNDLSLAPIPDRNGKTVRFIGIQRDITERKRIEEALREETAMFEALVESALDGILVVDSRGRHVIQNQRMREIWKMPPELAASGNDEEQLTFVVSRIQNPQPFLDKVRHLYGHPKEISRDEIELVDGTILDRYSAPVEDKAGKYYGRIWTFRDVTTERSREERLSKSLSLEKEFAEKARAGERAKSEFLAVMSHEVRTPLNGILGFAELLAEAPSLTPEYQGYSRTIVRSGEALLRILDDILDFSRLEAGRLQIVPSVFSPRALLEDIRNLVARQASGKGLPIHLTVAEGIPEYLEGDSGRIRQILLNLVGNALKFTDRGHVKISLTGLLDQSSTFVFVVSDTGPGIAPEHAQRIFLPFTQADSSIARRHGGTGLGLSISRRLTELLGGNLSVESQPGQGTSFALALPLRIARQASVAPVSPPGMDSTFATRHPLRLLLAEDDRVNIKLLQALIKRLGYEPLTARNGREAVNLYQSEKPDFILMDLQMPDMDGTEATRAIRALEKEGKGPPVFIAALTANIFPADKQKCLGAGMDDYLNKPIKLADLARVLVRATGNRTLVG